LRRIFFILYNYSRKKKAYGQRETCSKKYRFYVNKSVEKVKKIQYNKKQLRRNFRCSIGSVFEKEGVHGKEKRTWG
jgi:hypothetical protein